MAYRGLILDFGGVLTTPMRANGEAFERSENLTPGSYFHALEEHPAGVHIYSELEMGRASQQEWNTVIGGILGIDANDLMRRALANLHPEPRMLKAAADARAAGVRLALLSNSFGLEPFNPYSAHGVLELFDIVVLSEHHGVRKPDAAIYQRTLDLLQLPAEECVFVDDHSKNLPPAKALGITTIHHVDPSTTVARLRELQVSAGREELPSSACR